MFEDIGALFYVSFGMLDRLYSFGDILILLRFLVNDILRIFSPRSIARLIPFLNGPLVGILGLTTGTLGKIPIIGDIISDIINGPSSKHYFCIIKINQLQEAIKMLIKV